MITVQVRAVGVRVPIRPPREYRLPDPLVPSAWRSVLSESRHASPVPSRCRRGLLCFFAHACHRSGAAAHAGPVALQGLVKVAVTVLARAHEHRTLLPLCELLAAATTRVNARRIVLFALQGLHRRLGGELLGRAGAVDGSAVVPTRGAPCRYRPRHRSTWTLVKLAPGPFTRAGHRSS